MLSRILIFALLQCWATMALAQDFKLRDFSDLSGLTVSGEAMVGEDGQLVLTPSRTWAAGSIFSSQQISTNTFSTFFAFRMSDPVGGGADGIALVLQTVSASLGEAGGGMGYQNVPNSMAIEFDTWRNGWDADDNHLGLLINGSIDHTAFPAVPLAGSLEDGQPWYVWVEYDGALLSLRIAREKVRPEQATLEQFIDVPALLQSETAFVGFASATGQAYAKHEILEWTYLGRFAPEEIYETQSLAKELQERKTVDLDIEFEFNSDVLTAEGTAQLALFMDALRQIYSDHPPLNIIGHTDASGSDSYNLALSDRRSAAVKRALIDFHNYPRDVLNSEGRGESDLKFPNAPEADGNRRVEIRVSDSGVAANQNTILANESPINWATISGVYAPGGDCALTPRLSVEQSRVEFYGWEGGDSLFITGWRDCSDCSSEFMGSGNEVRISPRLSREAPLEAPLFRFNADGAKGLLIVEPGGDLSPFPEVAAIVDAGALSRCDVSQITATATLHPSAEQGWKRFDTPSRAGAAYCAVQDGINETALCLGLGCGYGRRMDWTLGLMGTPNGFAPSPAEDIQAEVLIDGTVVGRMTFSTSQDEAYPGRYAAVDSETHGVTIVQLQKGNEAELRLSSGDQKVAALMRLRGSSKALDGIWQTCGARMMNANPANRPNRFVTQHGASQPEAEALARNAATDMLAQMRTEANDPNIDIMTAWLIDLEDGWRFLLTEVGPSNFHFGMGGFGGIVLASPPGESFRRVGPDASAGLIWLDLEQRYQGWPRLFFQSARGVNPPFHVWRWNGQEYIYDREIQR